jgi:uncharacterized protein YaiE (UPF0345 family)
MSTPETNTTVQHNSYFEGKVQSLGLQTDRGRATVGVMKKGSYQFDTSTEETIIVISGTLSTRLPGADWQKHQPQDTLIMPANIVFDIDCDTDVAYICYYA